MSVLEDASTVFSSSFTFILVIFSLITRSLLFLFLTFPILVFCLNNHQQGNSDLTFSNYIFEYLLPNIELFLIKAKDMSTLLLIMLIMLFGLLITAIEMIFIQGIKYCMIGVLWLLQKREKWDFNLQIKYLQPPKYVDSKVHNQLTEIQLENENFHKVFEWQQFLNNSFWSLLTNYLLFLLLLIINFRLSGFVVGLMIIMGVTIFIGAFARSKIMFELAETLEKRL